MSATRSTASEKYLAALCRRSFLRLWSYPHVYRDQGPGGGVGKEVCDLLVVCHPHVLVFSDKQCAFPDSGDLAKDWSRWFRRAVWKSAQQVWGAERWISQFPERLFIDPACREQLPLALPPADQAVSHRIVVAHGSAQRCRAHFGGSGSLMLTNEMAGKDHFEGDGVVPFMVGQLAPNQGFVHVVDDFTLDVLLKTLNTITDFTRYLTQKERLFATKRVVATGEEDLLAHYLRRTDETGQHAFVFGDADGVLVMEGEWEAFERHPDRLAQLEADRISFMWDRLIDEFAKHLTDGTQYFKAPIDEAEVALRFMARESRTERRALAKGFRSVLDRNDERNVRMVMPAGRGPESPFYVFLTLRPRPGESNDEYRRVRLELLKSYCMVVRLQWPEARHVVGIATEPGSHSASRSEDLSYLDGSYWNDRVEAEARRRKETLGLLTQVRAQSFDEPEYPRKREASLRKGRNRNQPCPCGSGKKYKRCCGNT